MFRLHPFLQYKAKRLVAVGQLTEEELVAFANECLAKSDTLAHVDLTCEHSLRAHLLLSLLIYVLPTRGADNKISDNAAKAIAAALLQKNSSLKSINLCSAFCRDC